MKLLTNPCSYSNAIDLIKKGVDAISVGESSFSAKNSNDLSFVEIKKILKEKKKTKVFILVNKFFFDTDLVRLEKYLLKICKENIDGIIYSDYAVNQILFENKILINQIYNPETLVVSYGQFDFYKKNSINEVSLAREISSSNIKKILDNKNKMKVQIQVCGYSYMMWSRWDLLKNFSQYSKIKTSLDNKILYLSEQKRKEPFIIYEDKNGTFMYTNYNLNLLSKLKELQTHKIDTIRIDTFLHNEEWINETTDIFLEAIKTLELKDDKKYDELVKKSTEKLMKFDKIQSCGFYDMNKKDLIYIADEQ